MSGLLTFGAGVLVGLVVGIVGSLVVGIAGNVIAAYLWEGPMERWRRRRSAARDEHLALRYESEPDGMFRVNRWSPERPLTPDRLRVEVRSRPAQTWFDPASWDDAVAGASPDFAGECGYPIACSDVDFRESHRNMEFHVAIGSCDYAEGIATERLLLNSDERERVVVALRDDPVGFVHRAPRHPLALYVSVLSPTGSVLVIQRSATVATARSIWTVGPAETLTIAEHAIPGTKSEDFFELARRCLREELGLQDDDYGHVSISWFGYCAQHAHPWVFAQVRTLINEAEVDERMTRCFGTEEMKAWEWLPLDASTLRRVTAGTRNGLETITDLDDADRLWSIHAPLALHELWRMRSHLAQPARRR